MVTPQLISMDWQFPHRGKFSPDGGAIFYHSQSVRLRGTTENGQEAKGKQRET